MTPGPSKRIPSTEMLNISALVLFAWMMVASRWTIHVWPATLHVSVVTLYVPGGNTTVPRAPAPSRRVARLSCGRSRSDPLVLADGGRDEDGRLAPRERVADVRRASLAQAA